LLTSVEAQDVQLGPLARIADAGGNRQALRRRNRHAVRLGARLEDGPRFKADCLNPGQACRSAVCDEDNPIVGDNPGCFWKPWQCCKVSLRLMVDHLDAIAPRMRDEDTAALQVEGA
jgi:hypothetical protein